MVDRRPVDDLAGRVLDGAPIDWGAEESTSPDRDRRLLPHLQIVARIAQAHRGEPEAPLVWGHLEVRARIGSGAFGSVYRAWDTRLEREVALKLLNADDRSDGGSSVIAEGALLARVRHPNVVTVYGAERVGDRVGLWMELIEGKSIDRVRSEQGPFSAHEAALIGLSVCRALSAVHRCGLLHRDVKAQNVMREDGGRILLMDFGTGGVVGAERSSAALAGTPLYVAPELLEGAAPSVASDIYSIGILLFYLATSTFPVRGADLAGLRAAHVAGRKRFLRDERPDLPDDFVGVVEKAIAADPAARFATAGAMEAALAAVVANRSPPSRWGRRSVIMAGVTTAVAMVAALAIMPRTWSAGLLSAALLSSGGPPSSPPAVAQDALVALPSSIVVRQISFPAGRAAGRPSPDGRLFSFIREDGDLALLDIASLEVRRLTAHEAETNQHATYAAISADSRWVAYTWMALDGRYEMRVIGADGRRPRVVLRSEAVDDLQPLEWSRDGSVILSILKSADGISRLADVASKGGEVKILRALEAVPHHASRSPDGGLIVFDARQGAAAARDILVMSSTGADVRTLVAHPANDVAPVWTPDGRHVIFASDRSGTMDLWSVAVGEGAVSEPELIHRNTGRMSFLGLTDDGRYYFQSLVGAVEVYSATLTPDGRVGRPAALGSSFAGSNISSAWSPNGQRVAYASRRGLVGFDRESTTLVIVDPGTGERRDVVPALNHFMVRSWSPDSASVLVAGEDARDRSGLFSVDAATGATVALVLTGRSSDDISVGGGQWMPDGRLVYHRAGALRVRDQGGNEEIVLDFQVEGITGIDGPPAGKGAVMADDGTVAYCGWPDDGSGAAVLRVKPPGQRSRDLLRALPGERLVLQDLTRDAATVLFTRRRPGERSTLWRMAVSGGAPKLLELDLKAVRDVSLHPDGGRLTFTAGMPLLEVWVIEKILSADALSGSAR